MNNASVVYAQTYKSVNEDIKNNIERTNPQINKYLDKNVLFSDGTVCYVTKKGVVKKYEDGAPSITVQLGIPWLAQYTPGVLLPTKPPLIVGTPMKANTSHKHAGQNIYATELVNELKSNYNGCYANKSDNVLAPTPLSFTQCRQFAGDGKYKYFATQDNGNCIVSNEIPPFNLSADTIYETKNIWSTSTTSNETVAAFVNQNGNLVINTLSNNNSLWISPNKPVDSCVNGGDISIIDATYGGNCNTDPTYSVQNGNATNNVNKIVMDDNSQVSKYIFPIDKATFGDPAPKCNKSFDVNYMCGNTPFNQHIDDAEGKSAILSCSEMVTQCNFYLIVQDDGRILLCRGNPSHHADNPVLWSPSINVHVGDANPKWKARESKTGNNYIQTGETLATNEWIGSPNGRIRLILESDGTLVLQTSFSKQGCPNNIGTDKTAGWYEMDNNSKKTFPDDLGKLAYVDENLVRHDYPDNLTQYTSTYDQWNGFTSDGNNLGNAVTGQSQKDCENNCSKDVECRGYVWDGETQTCYPKSTIYPQVPRTPRSNFVISSKRRIPTGKCTSTPVPVDTVTFGSYVIGDNMTKSSPCSASIMVDSEDIGQINKASDELSNSEVKIVNDINALKQKINRQNKKWQRNQTDMSNEKFSTMDDINAMNHNSQLYVASNRYMFDALFIIGLGAVFVAVGKKLF